MSIGKTAYNALPRPGQTLALSVFGVRNRIRLWTWDRYLAEIAFTERMPREEQLAYVAARLRAILTHAVRTVPRYEALSGLLGPLGDPGADVYQVLAEFPVVTKPEVLAAPEAFRSRQPGPGRVVKTVTSGTTGTPFATWMHWKTFNETDALWWRRNAWSGYRRGEWIARIVGDWIAPLTPSGSRDPWRVSRVDRRLYLSTFHLSPESARSYLDVLERLRPEYLMGYPSSLEILAAYCLDAGRTLAWIPKRVWFSSEPMYEHQREIITRVFRAPIVGLFGSAERIISAAECESGSYHLAMVDGFVDGQFGRLDPHEPARVTTLMNRVMPLIRFELGDLVALRPDAVCPCGRTLPVMEPVVTKHEDWIDTPSGRRVSPSALTWAFKDLSGVRRSQIVQTSDRTIEVHVDADESAMDGITRTLVRRLGEMLFGEMDVTVVRDNEIRIMQSGKSRFVVRRPATRRAAGATATVRERKVGA